MLPAPPAPEEVLSQMALAEYGRAALSSDCCSYTQSIGLPSGQADVRLVYALQAAAQQGIAQAWSQVAQSPAAKRSGFEVFDEWFSHASAVAAPILVVLGAIAMAIGFATAPTKALRVFLPF